MVEQEGFRRYVAHFILWIGIAIVAFPVYIAIVASTQDNALIANGQMSLLPGGHFFEVYYQTIFVGTSGSTREPVGNMMLNSLVMALLIAVGKIAISIISAYAIVYFRFPFRMPIFWIIFITLMLPVEVRIYPTYKIVADLHMLDSYAGLALPLIASATATLLFRQFFMTVPDELLEASRIDGAGPLALLLGYAAAAVAHQHGGAVRDPLHPRLESISLAAADHHARRHADDPGRHPQDDHHHRRADRMAGGDGDRRAGHAAAGVRRRRHAEIVRARARGDGKVDLMANVTLRNVRKTYPGGFEAIKGVNVDVADGQFCVLVGPSGCGKSTLLRMVAGLETVSGGEIDIGGRVVNQIEPADRDIAMVFQNYALYPHMSVFNNMAYGLRNRGMKEAEVRTRVDEAARVLELTAMLERKPRQLSGGQRQRVAMGRAIVRQPKVFLFDEPLSNLDAKLRIAMRVEIRKLQRRLSTTSIYVTHDQLEAMTLADVLVVMNGGEVEQVGNPLAIYEKPATTFVASFIGAPPMNLMSIRQDEIKSQLGSIEAGILGIRPEDFVITDQTPAGGVALPLTVEAIERVGAETFIYGSRAQDEQRIAANPGELPPGEVIVRIPGSEAPPIGQKIRVAAVRPKLHLFSGDGRTRIEI